jgi:DNA helicase-2/ATP-dependent DNA helicase PcrA
MFGEAIGIGGNFTILDAEESERLMKQVVESQDKMFFKDKTRPKPGPLFGIISLARNTQLSCEETVDKYFPHYSDISDRLPAFAKAYELRKREQKVCDYDDLLEHWLALLKQAPDVAQYFQNRFRHVLVDEYQDTNTLQAQIVDTIASHHRVMAVGDDAQCIYSWRGANFENIITFPDRHPGTAIHRIETNYRSTPEILNLANGVLLAQPKGRHFDKELKAARGHMEKPFVVQAMDDREQAEFIVKRVRSLHEDEGASLNNIAVLYRSHFIAVETQIALARAGIPYHITSGVKFFERQHIRDLVALLRFVYNPADEQAWQRIAVLLPKVGEKGAQKIHAAALGNARAAQRNFLDVLDAEDVRAKVARDARPEWEKLVVSLRQVSESMKAGRPADAVETAIDGWYGDYLKGAYADYADRLEELNALVGFAQRFEETQDFLAQILLLNSETSDRNVDPDSEAIKLTTVHQAKGLEYDVVFVIGLADGQFPGRRSIEAGDVEEERRLFYVAVTRARNELYLSFPKIASRPGPGGMMNTPSRFLQELSPSLYQELKIRRMTGW